MQTDTFVSNDDDRCDERKSRLRAANVNRARTFFSPLPSLHMHNPHTCGWRTPEIFHVAFRILGIERFDASPNCPANIFRSITVEKQFPKFFLFKKSFFNAFIRNDRTRIKLRFLFGIVKEKFEKRKIPSREGNPFTR